MQLRQRCGGRPASRSMAVPAHADQGWSKSGLASSSRLKRRLAPGNRRSETRRDALAPMMPAPLSTAGEAELSELGTELGWPSEFEDRYSMTRCIGSGTYAIVYQALDTLTGKPCAVKVLGKERERCTRRKTLRRLKREALVLARCSGLPNVAALYGVFEKDSYIYLVLECLCGGDLDALLQRRMRLPEAEAACLTYECLKVLAACHAHRVVHGDVKPANFVLVHEYGRQDLSYVRTNHEAQVLKAIDFGCSQVVRGEGGPPLTKRTGTPVFMAPEVFNKCYDTQADMWSLGMVLHLMLAGRLPFWPSPLAASSLSLAQVATAVCSAPLPLDAPAWDAVSPAGRDLLARLLVRDPARRLTAQQALQHGWFAQFQ